MSTDQTFHRYRLIRRIARGGMAEVFLANLRGPSGFEKRVAIKKILPVYSRMEEFAVLFRDEARLSALLEHSAIVQTYEFGEVDGELFMAMEYVDGPDLEELLDRCRRRGILLPVGVVLHIVHELARALEYSHSLTDDAGNRLGLIHRDVSPPNLLIGVHGEIKLTDFGVARRLDKESKTRPGVLRGKYAYMSPEQIQQGALDHRSDIFSAGIVLYEALTGVNPFEETTDFQTMESVERAEVEPATFLRPDTPTELDRILLACLEPDPDLRYQNASDLRRDLGEVIRAINTQEGPEALVSFLRDVFPERAPNASADPAGERGTPTWEHLAHRLPVMVVPIPIISGDPGRTTDHVIVGDRDRVDPELGTDPAMPNVNLSPGSHNAADTDTDTSLEKGEEHAGEGVPVVNEWDVKDEKTHNRTLDPSNDLDVPPELTRPRSTDQPRQSTTDPPGTSAHKVFDNSPAAHASQPRDALCPPGRPGLQPLSRHRIEQFQPMKPLDSIESHSVDPPASGSVRSNEHFPTPPPRDGLTGVSVTSPVGSTPNSTAATAEEDEETARSGNIPRPLWATLVWAALAVLVPLGALASVQWLDDLQRTASTPKVARPVVEAPAHEPTPDRQLQPLTPTRPGASSPDADASKKDDGRD